MGMTDKLKIKGIHRFVFRDAKTSSILRVHEYPNIIVSAGTDMIAARLAGGSSDCDITYGAVGTNAAAPAIGNTTLGTELARNALTAISASGSIVSASTFFGAAEANGVLTEFALFGQGASASADSGVMINHAVVSETKTGSETLTVESQISIS